MNVLLFGATGMVGQGVLRECLLDADVQLVETVGSNCYRQESPEIAGGCASGSDGTTRTSQPVFRALMCVSSALACRPLG